MSSPPASLQDQMLVALVSMLVVKLLADVICHYWSPITLIVKSSFYCEYLALTVFQPSRNFVCFFYQVRALLDSSDECALEC